MRLASIISFIFFISSFLPAQTIYSDNDVEICNAKFEYAASEILIKKSIGDIIVEIGKTFLGLDYEAHTLETGDEERLVIHLSGLDCYTFLESALVFARCVKTEQTSFEDFQKELINVRYRNGKLDGYPSRLHYASDWLFDNSKRGILEDMTKLIGGIPYKKKIDYMSNHYSYYPRLKNNDEYIERMVEIEKDITKREKFYIPQDKICVFENKINNGDIILITAAAEGLDISHTGIAVKMKNGRIHFMHAPIKGKQIQITEDPLGDYIKGSKKHTGFMVARPLNPERPD